MNNQTKDNSSTTKLLPPWGKWLYTLMTGISGVLFAGIVVFAFSGGGVGEGDKPWESLSYWGWSWLILLLAFGVFAFGQYKFLSRPHKLGYIPQVLNYIVPIFLWAISIGIWVLIWATYGGNEQWNDVRPGIITGFTGLVAAVGVLATVSVNYKNHEENRIAQAENIEKQLEEQRKTREQQYKTEQERRDNETIKDLNERLHEILKNRHSTDENLRASSYFQLAALYKDWGLLGENSEIIEAQRKVQQKNILKLIFGTVSQTEEQEEKKSVRSFIEITTLNSVIADIFPKVSDTDEYKESFELFDLQYADLSGLNFDGVFFPKESNLSHADLTHATLRSANLTCVNFSGATLRDVVFLYSKCEYANFQDVCFQYAKLWNVNLQNSCLWDALCQNVDFQNADLQYADARGADFSFSDFQYANLSGVKFWGVNLQSANLYKANFHESDFWEANFHGTGQSLTVDQLISANNIESVETRAWNLETGEYGKEDQTLKNLIQEALEIQKQHKNSQPDA
ncbi:pentapeptide repeat-containing protein [Rothia sp. CCM 9418]|uniref:pentapeptide repeat-containing protein n=1 Tax=Rothia sp. CCM 9418 TaxID=3402661 RepID=UPI003AED41EC